MLPAIDDFTGTAGALAGSWTQAGAQNMNRSGSGTALAAAPGGGTAYVRWNADTFNDDHYAKVDLVDAPGDGSSYYVFARASGAGATFDAYGVYTAHSTIAGIVEFADGAENELLALATGYAPGDEMEIRVTGTLIEAYKNGSLMDDTTDATITSGAGGFGASGGDRSFDNFEADNLGGAAGTAAVTGTAASGQSSKDLRETAGLTFVATLTDETFIVSFTNTDKQNLLNGLVAAVTQTNGWNNQRSNIDHTTAVVRTSANVATITLPALPGVHLDHDDILEWTIPGSVLTGGSPIVATPTIRIAKKEPDPFAKVVFRVA